MKIYLSFFFLSMTMTIAGAQSPVLQQVRVKQAANTYLEQDLFVDPVVDLYLHDSVEMEKAGDWESLTPGEDGWFADRRLRGSFVHVVLESPADGIWLLNPKGVKWLYVNGRPLAGNRYQGKDNFEPWEPNFGFVRIPVRLEKGENHLLLRCNRGRFQLDFSPPAGALSFNTLDVTLPDLLIGAAPSNWGSVVVLNQSEEDYENLVLECSLPGGNPTRTNITFLPALSVQNVSFRIEGQGVVEENGASDLRLRLLDGNGRERALDRLTLNHRSPTGQHRRTYRSGVDGSVQYYAVQPATDVAKEQALVLSVHGANVEAWNQAGSYAAKSWAHIVAPTNRRPYGYNWEDWGRLDALAVLAEAKSIYTIDPDRIYLTGHSMGGHGTWVIGSTHPDQFAAIGPSAGYLTIGSYYRSRVSEAQTTADHPLLERSRQYSLTDSLLPNLKPLGVYVIHGDADRVVPPEQAYRALEQLATFHRDYVYHEEPGQGHWWDLDEENPGADCVDWAPLFDFFARRSRPGKERIREIEFTTATPAVSSTNYWATIYRQEAYMDFSRVKLRFDPGVNRISGQTENVSVLQLDPPFRTDRPLSILLDGEELNITDPEKPISLTRMDGKWKRTESPSPTQKGPHRYGGFKEVVNHEVVLVYGTRGARDERNWAREKALFDAQLFWYQGNGRLEVISDQLFDPEKYPDRNVILYGNARTNRAWDDLLADSPVQMDNRTIRIDDYNIHGKGLAALFIRPRKNTTKNLVGVVGGVDLAGMRLTNNLPYLYQGFALPDFVVIDQDVIGGGAGGIRRAGFFDDDWKVDEKRMLKN